MTTLITITTGRTVTTGTILTTMTTGKTVTTPQRGQKGKVVRLMPLGNCLLL